MKKKATPLILCLLTVFQILIVGSSLSTLAETKDNISIISIPFNIVVAVKMSSIERSIDFISGGYLIITDTFILSPTNASGFSISNYIVGLPKNCTDNLVYYSASDPKGSLKIDPIENWDGNFLWLNISFPDPIEIGDNETYNFTVTYVFFDLIMEESENVFNASFPLYPALMNDAKYCNVTVKLPVKATSHSQNLLNKTSDQTVFYNLTSPLPAFSNVFSWVEFETTTFKLFELKEVKREINIDPLGKIFVTDFYHITHMTNVHVITFILPQGASDISVYDAYGTYEGSELRIIPEEEYTEVSVYPRDQLQASKKAKIAISYTLPFWKYVVRNDWQDYVLQINITKSDIKIIDDPEAWIIRKIEVSVSLPEGAIPEGNLKQEWSNVTRFQELKFSLKYKYAFLWAALKPTLWTGLIIGLAGLIFFFIKISGKPVKPAAIAVSTETLRKFVETFEERIQVMSEIESLEQLSRRRKISRRRYKFQRRALENRLSILQENLSDLMSEIKSFGGRYADMMKQLEAATLTLEAINRNIMEVEARYRRGEISAKTRRKLLSEYAQKKEDAERTMDEILLRIREELA